jgi:hypothetical protein
MSIPRKLQHEGSHHPAAPEAPVNAAPLPKPVEHLPGGGSHRCIRITVRRPGQRKQPALQAVGNHTNAPEPLAYTTSLVMMTSGNSKFVASS